MSPARVLALAGRILRQFRHDRRTVALIVIVPVVVMALIGYLVSDDNFILVLSLGLFADALFGLIAIVNSGIGIRQELKAKEVLDNLALLVAPKAKVVVLTGYGSIATAVKATKLGAVGFLMKPTDVEQVGKALLEQVDDDTEVPIPTEFQSLYRHEREYIEFVLAACEGSISQAARRLGLHRQSLQRKLRTYTPH